MENSQSGKQFKIDIWEWIQKEIELCTMVKISSQKVLPSLVLLNSVPKTKYRTRKYTKVLRCFQLR